MRFAFIGAEKARHSVPMLCRMLKVSRSGYYAWCGRGPSRRALEDARLGTLIVASHRDGRGTYGSPRILDDLREAGERVSRKRVARLMTERNLVGEMKKRWRHPSSAPSDAVVARTPWTGRSTCRSQTAYGRATSRTCARTRAGSTSLSSSTSSRVESWAGRSSRACTRTSCFRH